MIGIIDREKLISVIRRNYEFNNNGTLPTIVYRSQPEYLKTPTGDTSNKAKMIQVFENTKPYDFLRFKNKGVRPNSRDLKLIEHLAVDYNLPPGVINVLIDYAIRVNDGKLNQKYLETIASSWNRKGVKTVPDAMDAAAKGHNRVVKTIIPPTKKEVEVPTWMNKEHSLDELTGDELKELEEEMKIFG